MSSENYDSFIYTHIPKCGGTSFRKFINDCSLASDIAKEHIYIPGFNGIDNNKNIPELNKEELKQLQQKKLTVVANHAKFNVHKEYHLNVGKPFYFTILRDPVKRFISHYNFFYFQLGYDDCKGQSLDDLEPEKRERIINHLSNVQLQFLADIRHPKIVGEDNMLRLAKSNLLLEYDCYGYIEDMERCLEKLKATAPDWLKIKSNFPTLNTSNSSKVKVSDEVLDQIEKANWLDRELYEFAIAHMDIAPLKLEAAK